MKIVLRIVPAKSKGRARCEWALAPKRVGRYFQDMNAAAIIDEIRNLPPPEQDRVVEFARTLETRRPWSGEKLTEYEKKMVDTNDPAEAQRLKEQIVAGFYGDEPDA